MQEPISAKIVIVGDGAIGKTCVMVRYAEGHFDTEYTPTIFENRTKQINFQGKTVNLSLWDTAGQEEYSKLRPIAYPNTDVFLISFSVVDMSSFVNAKKIWVREVKTAVPSAKVIFVGTKSDLRYSAKTELSAKDIDKNVAEQFSCEYKQCSAMEGNGIEQIFSSAVRLALEKQGHLKPAVMSKASSSYSKKELSARSQSQGQEKPEGESGLGCKCQLM